MLFYKNITSTNAGIETEFIKYAAQIKSIEERYNGK